MQQIPQELPVFVYDNSAKCIQVKQCKVISCIFPITTFCY